MHHVGIQMPLKVSPSTKHSEENESLTALLADIFHSHITIAPYAKRTAALRKHVRGMTERCVSLCHLSAIPFDPAIVGKIAGRTCQ